MSESSSFFGTCPFFSFKSRKLYMSGGGQKKQTFVQGTLFGCEYSNRPFSYITLFKFRISLAQLSHTCFYYIPCNKILSSSVPSFSPTGTEISFIFNWSSQPTTHPPNREFRTGSCNWKCQGLLELYLAARSSIMNVWSHVLGEISTHYSRYR